MQGHRHQETQSQVEYTWLTRANLGDVRHAGRAVEVQGLLQHVFPLLLWHLRAERQHRMISWMWLCPLHAVTVYMQCLWYPARLQP